FFSSRRRHTRWPRDWSSDVCSSDLSMLRFLCNPKDGISFARIANKPARGLGDALIGKLEAYAEKQDIDILAAMADAWKIIDDQEIGRASCRERVESEVVTGGVKKKK